jgi:hypothetical protein
MQKKVFHLFPRHIRWQINIFITIDGFQTLMDIVIINPINPNMVQHASSTTTHAMTIVNQEKTKSYAKRASRDNFNPFYV